MTNKVLIVDDDPVQLRLVSGVIEKLGHGCVTADSGQKALDIMGGADARQVNLIILDLVMPEMDGLTVLATLREREISTPVIVQTAQGGIETVVKAMRAGAFDFVVKPVSPERLQVSVSNAMKLGALEGEINRFKKSSNGILTFKDMISASPAMEKVVSFGEKAAASKIPVLIEGESGVGKELFARAIQGSSDRRSKPFITVNCGALPENLVESILFGHEKGAFTGANEKRIGKFEEANGGTLFLDEIGELPLDAQVKLLRAIQEGEVDPVGSRKPVKVDIRLISATNRNLLDEVKKGHFREDLFYRLNVLPITVPPLRDRRQDIPELLRHFTARIAAQEGRTHIRGISQHAATLLAAFDWPGNIRQLENAVFRAVVLCDGPELTVEEFPQIAAQMPDQAEQLAASQLGDHDRFREMETDLQPRLYKDGHDPMAIDPLPDMETPLPDPLDSHIDMPEWYLPLMDGFGHIRQLDDLEADIIRQAIDRYNGRMSEVARRLKIGRSTLYRKLKEYGLEDKSPE